MTLLQDAMEDCIFINKIKAPDGEGGFLVEWQEGGQFKSAVTFDNSLEARVAQKQDVSSVYTVYTPKNVELEYHDVFKRISDGKIFRVTSDNDDKKTPKTASFQVRVASAEEFVLN